MKPKDKRTKGQRKYLDSFRHVLVIVICAFLHTTGSFSLRCVAGNRFYSEHHLVTEVIGKFTLKTDIITCTLMRQPISNIPAKGVA